VEVVRVDELIRAEAPAGQPRSVDPAPSFEAVFSREFPRVARTIHHIVGDRARAEEVTQDAFLELLRHWRTVAGYDRPDLWVRRVAIRKAQRERHRAWRRVELERSTVGDEAV
jgi:DNA-directed RNA polymerase specialized sigma24 family protein